MNHRPKKREKALAGQKERGLCPEKERGGE